MLTESVQYEGVLHGLNEYHYRKLVKFLKNAFAEVEYAFHGETGSVIVRGPSAMFDADDENKTSVFDLLASELTPKGRGVILERRWSLDGTVAVSGYVFKDRQWQVGNVELDD